MNLLIDSISTVTYTQDELKSVHRVFGFLQNINDFVIDKTLKQWLKRWLKRNKSAMCDLCLRLYKVLTLNFNFSGGSYKLFTKQNFYYSFLIFLLLIVIYVVWVKHEILPYLYEDSECSIIRKINPVSVDSQVEFFKKLQEKEKYKEYIQTLNPYYKRVFGKCLEDKCITTDIQDFKGKFLEIGNCAAQPLEDFTLNIILQFKNIYNYLYNDSLNNIKAILFGSGGAVGSAFIFSGAKNKAVENKTIEINTTENKAVENETIEINTTENKAVENEGLVSMHRPRVVRVRIDDHGHLHAVRDTAPALSSSFNPINKAVVSEINDAENKTVVTKKTGARRKIKGGNNDVENEKFIALVQWSKNAIKQKIYNLILTKLGFYLLNYIRDNPTSIPASVVKFYIANRKAQSIAHYSNYVVRKFININESEIVSDIIQVFNPFIHGGVIMLFNYAVDKNEYFKFFKLYSLLGTTMLFLIAIWEQLINNPSWSEMVNDLVTTLPAAVIAPITAYIDLLPYIDKIFGVPNLFAFYPTSLQKYLRNNVQNIDLFQQKMIEIFLIFLYDFVVNLKYVWQTTKTIIHGGEKVKVSNCFNTSQFNRIKTNANRPISTHNFTIKRNKQLLKHHVVSLLSAVLLFFLAYDCLFATDYMSLDTTNALIDHLFGGVKYIMQGVVSDDDSNTDPLTINKQ